MVSERRAVRQNENMTGIIESVPNFSEGRDGAVIERLITALGAVPGAVLLDEHRDADHHRCVLTMAGSATAMAEAAFALVAKASECIDLTHHAGQHPRIGAADVLPFVPLHGSTMACCVELARQVGARIGRELRIPVFLYGEACSRLFRKRLEQIRKGGFEALRQRMATDPAWAPDFGPPRPHPTAGAIAVGARFPLIAYNVCLRSRDVSLARAVAGTIRAADGGLPGVKAVGLALKSRGMVQVSMNLTDYRQTPVHVAFEAVKNEAARLGVAVAQSELVGLIPREAFARAEGYDLQCDALTHDPVLENRLTRCGVERSV